jgi:hypothetical protein
MNSVGVWPKLEEFGDIVVVRRVALGPVLEDSVRTTDFQRYVRTRDFLRLGFLAPLILVRVDDCSSVIDGGLAVVR